MNLQQIKDHWKSYTTKKRIAVLVFLTTVIAGVALTSWYLFAPKYIPLFTNLNAEQAYNISETLRRENLPFKLAASGTTITVPQGQVHEIRIRMAGEGLHSSGIGFELFDGVRLGITDFERRLNLQRALQEELRRTIVQFSEIEQARVHLVIPEQSLFQRESQLPTASVAIKLGPLQQLKPEQVRSLVYLVSMSVPSLPPENVTIIDMAGRILSDSLNLDQDSNIGLSTSQMSLKRDFEEELEKRLLKMLEQIFGPGKAVAMVNADLNFDHSTVTQIIFDSDNAVLRSEHVIRERIDGSGPDGGVPGTGSNIPVYPVDGETGEYIYERDEHTRNWEIGSSEITTVTAPGRVQRLSASVTVSANLRPEQKTEIEALVAGAMGLNLVRGDSLNVAGIAFNTEHLDNLDSDFESIARREMIQQYLSYGLKGLALILGSILIMVMGTKLLKPSIQEEPELVREQLDSILTNQAAAAKEGDSDIEKIRKLVESKPTEVAEIMRVWAYEE